MTLDERILQTETDMVLTDAFWVTVNCVNDGKIDPEKLLVLFQYMLTAYLSTIPDMSDVQVQVLELLRQILPKDPLPEE